MNTEKTTQIIKQHIKLVQDNIYDIIAELTKRAAHHDESKLVNPELEGYSKVTDKIEGTVYGTPEYIAATSELGPALKHHYQHNSHHPEHYINGIQGMNLIDIIEMFCGWQAAATRNGDIRKSIEVGQSRYDYGDDIKQILLNTVDHLDASIA